MINKDRLKNICADIGVELDAQALERFELFASMLVEKNKVLNLTAITDPEGIAVKHFADSLTALRMIDLQPGTKVIDVGTGGGFPGIPLLIARPEIKLTMLDSTGKKLAFVSQSVEELGLSANIVHARAEEAGQGELRESFDFAVSRAVAAMNILCEYCLPFVKVGGTFCAMKGAKGAEELDCAGKAIATLGGETQKTETLILPDGGERVLINVKKSIAHCDKIPAPFGTDFKKAARITGKSSRTAHFCPTENSGQPPFPVICFYHRGTAVLLLSERTSAMEVSKAGAVLLIPVDKIRTNPNQPRKYFDPDELSSLGESIRRNGILQPLSVRAEDGDGKYELIAGERRLRAATESGFDRVPCIVINADSTQAAVYSVIENLQRRDLNFFEEALAIESLGERYGLDRAQLSERLGKAPSTLSNKLRLLRLPEDIREKMISADLTERHARALLRIEDLNKLHAATDTVIKRSLNVAQTEKLVNAILDDETAHKPRVIKLFKDVRIFVNTINHAVDTMREAGIRAESLRTETQDSIEFTVRIPKEFACRNAG